MSEAFGAEESSSNFIFNDQLVFKSISSLCILLGIFIIFCSLGENGFIERVCNHLLYQNHDDDFQIGLAITSFFAVYFANLPRSAAHSLCSIKCGNWHKSSSSNWETNIVNFM